MQGHSETTPVFGTSGLVPALFLAFTPRGNILGDRYAKLAEYRTTSQYQAALRCIHEFNTGVDQFVSSPDGALHAYVLGDHIVEMHDQLNDVCLGTITTDKTVTCISGLPAQSARLAVAHDDGTVIVWDGISTVDMEQCTSLLKQSVSGVMLSFDEEHVAGTAGKSLYVWNSRSGALIWEGQAAATIISRAYSQTGREIVTATEDDIQVWDSKGGLMLSIHFDEGGLIAVTFSSDGRCIFAATNTSVTSWNTVDGTARANLSMRRHFESLTLIHTVRGRPHLFAASDEMLVVCDEDLNNIQ